jgi:hypothetical protein
MAIDGSQRGTITIIRRPREDADAEAPGDLFEREEHPVRVVLAIVARTDANDLIDTLEAENIGARLGDPTPEEGVEIIVHDTKLADAQAILVDFTGDPSLVDDMKIDGGEGDDPDWPDGRPDDDGFVAVSSGVAADMAVLAERLAAAGIDVRMEVPDPADRDRPGAVGALWVDREDLDIARTTIGIER